MLTHLVIFLLRPVSYLPLKLLYLLSDLLYLVLYHFVKYRRAVVYINLKNSFPLKTEDERKQIARQFYCYLCDLIVESVKMISISEKEARERFRFLNPEILEAYLEQNQSVIAAAGHYGNWEMASNIGLLTNKKVLVVYKPLSDPIFERFLKKVRSRFGARLIPMKSSFREILSYRKEATVSILVSDQTPTAHDSFIFTSFLNQQTAVFTGIEKLATAYNYPVLYCDVKIVKRGYYTCEFVLLADKPKECPENKITIAHVKYLDGMIQEQPQYWIWSHRRWKLQPR